MQLYPTLANATRLSYKSRLMKQKLAAFITKPRKLRAAYFRVTSNMTACSGFLTLQTRRNLVNLRILLVPKIKDKNATIAPLGVHVEDNRLLPLRYNCHQPKSALKSPTLQTDRIHNPRAYFSESTSRFSC
jgi:hypothetical protein